MSLSRAGTRRWLLIAMSFLLLLTMVVDVADAQDGQSESGTPDAAAPSFNPADPQGGGLESFTVVVESTVVQGSEGDLQELASAAVPEALIGASCTPESTLDNQRSVHSGNDLIVASGDSETVLSDVESEVGKVTVADGPIVMSDTVTITLRLGPEGIWSGGLSVEFTDCESVIQDFLLSGQIYASASVGTALETLRWGRGATVVLEDVGVPWVQDAPNDFFALDPDTRQITLIAELGRPPLESLGDARNPFQTIVINATAGDVATAEVTISVADFFDDDNPDVYDNAATYEDAINWLGDPDISGHIAPITSGCTASDPPVFCPTPEVAATCVGTKLVFGCTLRGQMAVFIARLWSLVASDDVVPFADTVPPGRPQGDHPFLPFINAIKEYGITLGCDNRNNFCPDESLEWGEAAMLLARTFNEVMGITAPTDTQGAALEWLTAQGYTAGILAEDLCASTACENVPIERGPTALLLRNIWEIEGIGLSS